MKIKKTHLKKLIREFLETDEYSAITKRQDKISSIAQFAYDIMPEEFKQHITNDVMKKVEDIFNKSNIMDESTRKTKRHIKASGILDKVLSDTRLTDYVEVDGEFILSGILVDPSNPSAGLKSDEEIKSMFSDIIISSVQNHMSKIQNVLLSGTLDPMALVAGAKQSDSIIGDVPAFFLLLSSSAMPLLFAVALATEPSSNPSVAFMAIVMYATLYMVSVGHNTKAVAALDREGNNYVDDLFQIHSDKKTDMSGTLLERHVFDIFSDSEKQDLSDKISELKEIRDTQKALSSDPKYIENLKAFVDSHEASDKEHEQLMQKYTDVQNMQKDILSKAEQRKKDMAEKDRVEKEIIDSLLDAKVDTSAISRSSFGLDDEEDIEEEEELQSQADISRKKMLQKKLASMQKRQRER